MQLPARSQGKDKCHILNIKYWWLITGRWVLWAAIRFPHCRLRFTMQTFWALQSFTEPTNTVVKKGLSRRPWKWHDIQPKNSVMTVHGPMASTTLKAGYFYYQIQPYYKNKIPYMRWSQAWMLLALATLLEQKDSSPQSRRERRGGWIFVFRWEG